jgi:hypothetical protein
MTLTRSTLVFLLLLSQLFSTGQGLIFEVLSPSEISGPMPFGWAQPNDGWGTPDFSFGGNVQGELALANDGSPGLNAQGNPVSAHACNPLINDMSGKIAVVFRNDCEFGLKALNAQNAGAIGVVIVNNGLGVVDPSGGNFGFDVFIPVVLIGLDDGETLVAEMNNGPVTVFFGSKIGLYNIDFGFESYLPGACALPFGLSYPDILLSQGGQRQTFIQADVINYGTQSGVATVTVVIEKDGQILYNESAAQSMNGFGELLTFVLPDFTNYSGIGEYTLTYAVTPEVTDEEPSDNIFQSSFVINESGMFSFAEANPIDGLILPSDTYYGVLGGEFQSCIQFTDPNTDGLVVEGLWFSAATPEGISIAGKNVQVVAHKLEDGYNPLDSDYFFEQEYFETGSFTFESNLSEATVYAEFNQPVELNPNSRYLFCVASSDPDIYLGVDLSHESHTYQTVVANYELTCPWYVEGVWYGAGYGYDVVNNIGLQLAPAPIAATASIVNQIDCPADCDGVIQVQANQPNVSITWFNEDGAIPFITASQLSNACEGTYYAVLSTETESVTTNSVTIQAPVSELVSSVTAPLSVECGSTADILLNIATTASAGQNTTVPYSLNISVPQGLTNCDFFGISLSDVLFEFGGLLNGNVIIGGVASDVFEFESNGFLESGNNITISASNFDYTSIDPSITNCTLPIQFIVTLVVDGQVIVDEVYSTNPNQAFQFLEYTYSASAPGTVEITWNDPAPTLIDENNYLYSATLSGTTDYSVEIAFTDACGNTQVDLHEFTIEAPTNFGLSVLTNPTAGPTPFNAVFNNQTPGLTNYSFEWDFGDGTTQINNASFVTHTYTTGGFWDLTLTATELSTGCQETLFFEDYIYSIGDGCLNPGCQDPQACNYDETADCEDDSCAYAEPLYDCLGDCLNDADNDGVCDELEVEGCTSMAACNYSPEATDDNGECLFAGTACNDGDENTINDVIGDDCSCQGTLFLLGCTNANACNYNPNATNNDGSCVFPPTASISGSLVVSDFSEAGYTAPSYANATYTWTVENGVIQSGQSTETVSVFWATQGLGQVCVSVVIAGCPESNFCTSIVITPGNDIAGCTNESACNYNPDATLDDGNCTYPGDSCNDGDGSTIDDTIGDDCICQGTSTNVFGCTDASACNYNPDATADDASCFFIGDSCDDGNDETENDTIQSNCLCEGEVIEVEGCTDASACNYNPDATVDDASCFFVGDSCDDGNAETENDTIQSNCLCEGEVIEVEGCTDASACNYNPLAVIDDGSCEFVIAGEISGDILPSAFSEHVYTYPSTAGSTYQWSAVNGVISSGQGSNEVTVYWGAEGTGSLSVQETTATDCLGGVITLNIIVTPVDVPQLSGENLRIFPNPANEQLFVKGNTGSAEYFVHNSMGQLVLHNQATGDFLINTSELATGSYQLTVLLRDQVSKHPFIVTH